MIQLQGFLLALRHAARTGLRGKRLVVLVVLGVVPLLAMLSVGKGGGDVDERAWHIVCYLLVLQFVVPFSALFLGTFVLGDELEGRTVTYLFTRPVDRGLLYLGRLIGTGLAHTLLLGVLLYAALHARDVAPGARLVEPARVLGLGIGGFWVYLAFFACLRTIWKRALLVGMAYIMVVDLMISKMPYIGIAKLSVWHHMMVIYTGNDAAGVPGLTMVMRSLHADETPGGAGVFLVAAFGIAAALGAWLARTREYHVAGAVA